MTGKHHRFKDDGGRARKPLAHRDFCGIMVIAPDGADGEGVRHIPDALDGAALLEGHHIGGVRGTDHVQVRRIEACAISGRGEGPQARGPDGVTAQWCDPGRVCPEARGYGFVRDAGLSGCAA